MALCPLYKLVCDWNPGPGMAEGFLVLMEGECKVALVEGKLKQHEVNRWRFLGHMKYGSYSITCEDDFLGGYADALLQAESRMLDVVGCLARTRPWGGIVREGNG